MTAVPKPTGTDTFGIKWYRVACPRCDDLNGVERQYGPTLDACVAHDARHAGRDAAGVA